MIHNSKIKIRRGAGKRLEGKGNRQSRQENRGPESRIFRRSWILAFARMPKEVFFARDSEDKNLFAFRIWYFFQFFLISVFSVPSVVKIY